MNHSSRGNQKKKAIVLGGTYPHIELLKNLSRRGYETVLIDYYETPCAKPFADIHIQESTLNQETVLEVTKKEQASLVISACIDQANLIACSVAVELGLPHPYNTAVAKTVTNKVLMKKFMVQNGVPTSPFLSVRAPFDVNDLSLGYPLIVKPSDSNSSKGVTKIDNPDQLSASVATAIKLSRSREAIIEEFIVGREIGFDFFVTDHDPVLLITKERRKIPGLPDSAQQIYGCFWPAVLTYEETQRSIEIARNIVNALGLHNCPLMIQAIVNESGINVIEFAARFGGGESVTIIKAATGVDIIDLSVSSFLRDDVSFTVNPIDKFFSETFFYANECIFGAIEFDNEHGKDTAIDCLHQYKTRGMRIDAELTSNNRVGCFVVSDKDRSTLRAKVHRALSHFDVVDVDGNSQIRRELYGLENLNF